MSSNGPKWATDTVSWSFGSTTYVQDSATPFTNTIGGAYQSVIEQAMARWSSVCAVTFVQVPDAALAGQSADIRIGFADLHTPTTNLLGYTNFTYTSGANGASLFSPDIVVRLEDPALDALVAASGGGYVYQGYMSNLYQVALHEFGRTLGLTTSSDPNSIMFANLGPSNLDLDASDIANIQALYGAPAPAITQGGTFGSGADTLTVTLAEDAYQGDAQARITLDGVVLAAPVTVTALRGAGAQEAFTFKGNFGSGSHTVGVTFLNDAWGGSASTDRNLYVDGVALNGAAVNSGTGQSSGGSNSVTTPAPLYQSGDSASFTVFGGTNPPMAGSAPVQPDVLTLHLSEDAWQGDAQFVVSIDGHQLGAAQTVTASHGAAETQAFSFSGTFGLGPHDLAVSFINDAWGGTPSTDRNLYVLGAEYDGQHVPHATAALYTTSTTHFSVPAASNS